MVYDANFNAAHFYMLLWELDILPPLLYYELLMELNMWLDLWKLIQIAYLVFQELPIWNI